MAIEYAKKLRINAWIEITLEERQLKLKVDQEKLTATSLFDGCYVIKTDVPVEVASKEIIHRSYKDLALVEQAFRTSKTVQLEMRPIYVRLADRTRGHVFVVMLAYRIIKELTKYWQTLDVTVDEGIAALSSLCQIEITINGQSYNQIPKPDALCEKLLQLAQVTLPTVLPKAYANVTTRKKLQTERKTI